MKGADMEHEETRHGWTVGWDSDYPEVMLIECPTCDHLSVRDESQVKDHECPCCGRTSDVE